jgi:hypothetical protein
MTDLSVARCEKCYEPRYACRCDLPALPYNVPAEDAEDPECAEECRYWRNRRHLTLIRLETYLQSGIGFAAADLVHSHDYEAGDFAMRMMSQHLREALEVVETEMRASHPAPAPEPEAA